MTLILTSTTTQIQQQKIINGSMKINKIRKQ